MPAAPARGGASDPRPRCPCPIAEVDTAAWAPAATHVGELDRVLQGGFVPGSVTVLGGRAGHRQVHPAPPGAGRAGQGRAPLPLRHGGGVGPAGAAAGGAAWAPCRRTSGSCPTRPSRTCSAHIESVAPDVVADRLDPDRVRALALLGPRVGRAGARVRPSPRPCLEGAGDVVDPRRPRHQGRRPRRATRARAPRRHRAVLRGRAPPRAAPAARREAPVRLHRRARALRDDRRRPRGRARPVGAVPRRPEAGHARLGRGTRARRSPSAARRGAGPRRPLGHPHAPPLGAGPRQRAARPRASPCCSSTSRCRSRTATSTPSSPAACGRSSPGPTSPWRSRSRRPRVGLAGARRPRGVRRGRPRRRAAPGAPDRSAARRSGAARVPARRSCRPARRSQLPGIDVIRVATLARGRRRLHRRAAHADAPPEPPARPSSRPGAPGSIGRWHPAAAPSS